MSAPDETDPLLEAALSMADDRPVDWQRAIDQTPALAGVLANLRDVAALGDRYQDDDPDEAPPAAVFGWGPLRVLRKLGEGASADVWEAWDPSLQRRVALKLRRPGAAAGAGSLSWLGEARKLARVRHEHVLAVLGADVHGGRAGLWTELLEGRTLEAILREGGAWSAREATLAGIDLCAALAAVHGAGLAHGDVKAANVMRVGSAAGDGRDAGRIVLMDFGTAHDASPSGARGSGVGTPLTSAPEVLGGGALSVPADLYSLGVLLYRLVTCAYPIPAETIEELRDAHAHGAQRPLRSVRPDLPPGFVQAVERALAHDPAQRYRDAAEMERALAASMGVVRAEVARRESRARLLLAAAAGALLVGLAWAGVQWLPGLTRPRFHLSHDGPAVATQVLQTLRGGENTGQFGYSIAAPGDLDGDGVTDLLVGAPGESLSCGRVHLFRGQADGTFRDWRSFSGTGTGAFGFSLAALGDVNGDGRSDFAIGAPSTSDHGAGSGSVEIFFGDPRDGGRAAFRLTGPRMEGKFGYAVAGAGDVNHDGYADVIVGAPLDNLGGRSAGIAYLFLGGPRMNTVPDLVLGPGSIAAQFGISVAGIGDFNGDGFDDVAVGANFDRKAGAGTGHVAVFFGGAVMDAAPDLDLYGARADSWFGISVAGIGDMDGDGFDDLAVGAERDRGYEEYAGSVSIFRGGQQPGSRPARVLGGPRAGAKFGHALACDDLNGDGHSDLVVGGYGVNDTGTPAGEVVAYYGGEALDPNPELRFPGTDEDGSFGTCVTTVPGPAGGFPSPIVGASTSGSSQAGAVWIFNLSRYAFTHPRPDEAWRPGAPAKVAWRGRERAMLEWASPRGGAWHELARGVGGREENERTITVPAGARGELQLRLRPADPRVGHEAVSAPVRLTGSR
jgi:hypothetical protein